LSKSIIKQLASETAIYGMSSIVGRMLFFLLTPLYTHILPKQEYGIITELFSYIAFIMVLFTYRMETAYFRYQSKKDEPTSNAAYATALYSILLSSIIFVVILLMGVPFLSNKLHYQNHPEYFVMIICIIGLDAITEIPLARLRLENKAPRFALIKLCNIMINIGLNLFFLVVLPWLKRRGSVMWFHEEHIIDYIFLSTLISSASSVIMLLPQYLDTKMTIDNQLRKKMQSYALPLVWVGLAGIVNETLDRSLLKWLLTGTMTENQAMLGEYGACYKLAMLISLFTQAFRYAAEPFFFKNMNKADELKTNAEITKYFAIFNLFGFLGIALYIDVFKYFIGRAYWDALGVVPILLMANFCLGLYYNVSVWYRIKDKTRIGALIATVGAIITILLNVWWIPIIGYWGSAWATLICYFVMLVLTWYIGRFYYPVPYDIKAIQLYLVVALSLFFIGDLVGSSFLKEHLVIKLLFNTVLMVFFALVVAKKEQRFFFAKR